MIDVGKMIARIRKERGLSQQQLADKLGMTKQAISHYETGKREPDYVTLEAIADILNVPMGFLITEEDQQKALRDIYSDYKQVSFFESDATQEQEAEPDFEAAAIAAAETLVRNKISAAPIFPLQILTSIHNVLAVSFTEFADRTGFDRSNIAIMFGVENQDAITYAKDVGGKLRFFVAYNQRLPFYMLQFALARELGHIVLGHNNLQPNTVQTAEAMLFARHLLCPRPLIKAITDSGKVLTVSALGNITGCYGRSLAGLRQTPGAHVPSKLNRRVREMFAEYTRKMLECIPYVEVGDDSGPADFGTYMDNYEE